MSSPENFRRKVSRGDITPPKPGWKMPFDPLPPLDPPVRKPKAVKAPRAAWWISGALAFAAIAFLSFAFHGRSSESAAAPAAATPAASKRSEFPAPRNFPLQDTLTLEDGRWETCYAPDSLLQARASLYLQRYKPEGAVLVACDLRTGVIKALAERDSSGQRTFPQLALRGHFPAASLVKIVTAASALEWKGMAPEDSLPLLGRSHTLYRFQLRAPERGNYPKVSLRDAFAKSTNPAFGILGLRIGPDPLRKMGARMGFRIDRDAGAVAEIPSMAVPDSGYGLAEVACGFVTSTTISPLHALRIARALGSDGVLLPPRFSPELRALEGGRIKPLPAARPEPFVSAAALDHLQAMMGATVSEGTARKGFRRSFRREELDALVLGGKTGSLDGQEPRGRYEWYTGYAYFKDNPDRGVAVAIMLINQNYVAIHAGELAALLIRDWARAARKATVTAALAAR